MRADRKDVLNHVFRDAMLTPRKNRGRPRRLRDGERAARAQSHLEVIILSGRRRERDDVVGEASIEPNRIGSTLKFLDLFLLL